MLKGFKRAPIILFLFIAIAALTHYSISLKAKEILQFDYSDDTVEYNAVRNALKEELAWYTDAIDNQPPMAIARTDLNMDGKDEIIAILNEETLFCDQDLKCPHYVFTYTRSGLIKIGEFKTVGLTIADSNTSGIRDIITYPFKNSQKGIVYYKWAGRSYQAESK